MWMSSEEARSDFILAVAGMVLGTQLVFFVQSLPLYPGGRIALLLRIVWIVLLTIVVARFFVTYRGQGLSGYGLSDDRGGLTEGLLVAAPLAIAGYVRGLGPYDALGALLGRGAESLPSPTVGSSSPFDALLGLATVAVGALGAMMMYGLLVTRARDGFRSQEIPLVQALRTYGLGAVAISTLLGVLIAAGTQGMSPLDRLYDGIALAATVLLADRAVASGDRTSRATVLAPAIAALVATVVTVGGGIFGSGLVVSLWRGTAAAAVAIVVAALIETRRAAWAAVPLVAVVMWAPTCTMLPIGGRGIGGCI